MANLTFYVACMVLAIGALGITTTDAVKCYDCAKKTEPKCDDPFGDGANVKTCNGTVCFKGFAKAGSDQDVVRGCQPSGSLGCTGGKVGGAAAYACYCNTDLCNSAIRGVLSNYVMFIAVGLAVIQAAAGQHM